MEYSRLFRLLSSSRRIQATLFGFTLIELLVSIGIGSIVLIMAAQSLISHIQVSSRSESFMRAQETWNRVRLLIDQDIEESKCITIGQKADSLNLSFNHCDQPNVAYVIYQLDGTKLVRTGPKVNNVDGTLNLLEASSGYLTSTVADNVKDFSVVASDQGKLAIKYSLNITDPAGFTFKTSKSTSTHAKSRIIDSN